MTIRDSIRDAAIHWPRYMSDIESEILHVFTNYKEPLLESLYGHPTTSDQARVFMLLVAEAL
jgi:hypothetical protein